MSLPPSPLPLDILGIGIALPEERKRVAQILEDERETADDQLSRLTEKLRARVVTQLGLETVSTMTTVGSTALAERAALAALDQAGIEPTKVGLILDFSTLAIDCPPIWSLSHHLQGFLEVPNALALGARGSGCAGLHVALLVAQTFLGAHPALEYVLLTAADRAPANGRCCLPISIMADAASAMVVARAGVSPKRWGRIHSIAVQQYGKFADVLMLAPDLRRMSLDSARFEQQVLPLHFIMLRRTLARACGQANVALETVRSYVYPNTTALDRSSVARGFEIDPGRLAGPGPQHLGHAFANDLLINAQSRRGADGAPIEGLTAWLASGSGFSWGAAIVEVD